MSAEAHDAIAAVWKAESARVVGALARIVRDVGLAEELAQDALVAALEEWPRSGIPDRPGAWLMTTAKNRAINALRHRKTVERHASTSEEEPDRFQAELEKGMDEDIADDVLRLAFIACHPVLSQDARVALTLRLLGGLSTQEIARAFLSTEPTIAQRIVRAKRTLEEAHVPFELPRAGDLGPRLASVLEVVYLIFNEGYSATSGEDLVRPALVLDALRLGRMLAALAPEEPEVHALLALMELQASRIPARTDANGEPVLLMDQDRSRWDASLVKSGLARLEGFRTNGGPYRLQAEIAACHARARKAEDTDWKRIAELYEELGRIAPSPVIALNHAVAVSRAERPEAGLVLLDALAGEPMLSRYHLLPAARADLLEKLGRLDEARTELERAASLTDNAQQKARLMARAKSLSGNRS